MIDDWDVGKIKRMGGDAVKVLAWYRPDASDAVNQHQKDWTKRIGEACAKFDIPFLFELLVHPLESDSEQTSEYIEMNTKRAMFDRQLPVIIYEDLSVILFSKLNRSFNLLF